MSRGFNNKLTAQVGEYLVCAELGRRGYIATPFAGNVPAFDVIATDEQCRTVPIQVKATQDNSWPSRADLWMDISFRAVANDKDLLPTSGKNKNTAIQQVDAHGRNGMKEISNPNLIYVHVAIGKPGGTDQFFLLTKADLQAVCKKHYWDWMGPKDWFRPYSPKSLDCRFWMHEIEQYRDNWDLVKHPIESVSASSIILP